MKYIAENAEDILKLAKMLIDGQITAEEYFEAADNRAKRVIEEELKQRSVHKTWIKTESIRGNRKSWWQRFKHRSVRVSLD